MVEEKRKLSYSLQTSIAFLFSVIVVAFGLVIFFLSYFTFDDLIRNVSERALSNSTRTVNLKLTNLLSPYSNFSAATNNLYRNGLLDFEDKVETRKYFLGIISANPAMYSIYIAKPSGSFFQIKKDLSNPGQYIEEDFDRNGDREMRTRRLLKPNGEIINETVIEEMEYDPRVRDWYQSAIQHRDPVWSSIYKFAIKQERELHGITHSQSVHGNSGLDYVFGIDVETNDLVDFIGKQKIYQSSMIYLIDKDGKILSSSEDKNGESNHLNKNLSDDPKLLTTYEKFQKEKVPEQHSTFGGESYLASYRPVDDLEGANWTIGHIVDYSEITKPLRRLILLYWSVMSAATIISILLAVYASGKISRPINILAAKAKKLARLELGQGGVPHSNIVEIRRLSKSVESMDAALGSFSKYMPTNLVKKLLKQKLIAQPGGSTRVLPVMFLDFKNFTTVSETMSPSLLMEYLSGYLECMTNAIHSHDGTVDKYIGDSIMAFWGAPGGKLDVRSYTLKACECALAMQNALKEHNDKMKKYDLPLLEMRIGLHVGEMIVGNLGSSDKLNYTVIGDNVNLASRLESLCKYYHVDIVVSEDVQKQVEDELKFLLLDRVKVKGKSVAIKVFELQPVKRFSAEDQALFEQMLELYIKGNWEEADRIVQDLLVKYPEDGLLHFYQNRFQEHGKKAPTGWNGSWTMETK